jgi:hypothetical protein
MGGWGWHFLSPLHYTSLSSYCIGGWLSQEQAGTRPNLAPCFWTYNQTANPTEITAVTIRKLQQIAFPLVHRRLSLEKTEGCGLSYCKLSIVNVVVPLLDLESRYPILYCMLITPLFVVRWVAFQYELKTGKSRHWPVPTLVVMIIFSLSGVLDAALYLLTRRRFFQPNKRREPHVRVIKMDTTTGGHQWACFCSVSEPIWIQLTLSSQATRSLL